MTGTGSPARGTLTALVGAHLIIAIVHGLAHDYAHVTLSAGAMLFVFVVILAGPVAGVALAWRSERAGLWLVAISMAGSFAFGLVNHFVLSSADHVAHVDPAWRPLFATTAALLALTEAAGCTLAIALARERVSVS